MDISLTVVDARTGARADVALAAPEDTPVRDVLASLARAVGRDACGAAPASVDRHPLDGAGPLCASPLREGSVVTIGAAAAVTGDVPLLELRIVAGAGAGAAVALGEGSRTVGRGVDCEVRLSDPRVSRRHLLVEVTEAQTVVTDLGSANGTTVDGVPLGREPMAVAVGSLIRVGDTVLSVAAPADPPADVRPGAGRLQVNRPPRLRQPVETVRIDLPAPPTPRQRARLPLLAAVAPLALGVVLAMVIRQWQYLLFTAMSPVLVVAQSVSDRRAGRRSDAQARREHEQAVTAVHARIADAVDAEQLRRREAFPDLARVRAIAEGPRSRLWERRPADDDFLALRLGIGDLPASVQVVPAAGAEAGPGPVARAVPVVVPLAALGVVGISARDGGLSLGRAVVGQAAALHSSRDLAVVVLTDRGADWEWVRWLPHTGTPDGRVLVAVDDAQVAARVAELTALVTVRRAGRCGTGTGTDAVTGRRILVVLDGARRMRSVPGVAELLVDGPDAGVHFLCLDADARALPQECRGVAVVDGARLSLQVDGHPPTGDGVADLPGPEWADQVARALAPLFDTGIDDEARLPDEVRWSELANLQLGPGSAGELARRWAAGPQTAVRIGVTRDGPLVVDLRRDGPHALVAGTTGSGKSELLRALVAGLAAANRPDELTFVLVDYKGGAAFGPCARLPHTVGMVTDLDPALTERALVSLSAELRRREALLADAGAASIDDYATLAGRRAQPPLPRLVLVVDEFATLAEELPEFVGGLVGIAQRGRSLGVHLVLATQRPEGVVSNDIRANTNLRICLAVTRDGESRDVIDAPDAARISRTTPGRGYLRTGHGELTAFQTARVSGMTRAAGFGVRVLLSPFADVGNARQTAAGTSADGHDDLESLVAATVDAAGQLGISPPASPWLPPLPDLVTVAELPPADGIGYAVVDRPEEQSQEPLALDLDRDGHLLVVGTSRSGRTTTLRTLCARAADRFSTADLHLYAVDAGGGGLLPLTRLPHCGAVVAVSETERVERLLTMLSAEVTRRLALMSSHGAASVAELRAAGEPLPQLLVAVDRWDALQAACQDADGGRVIDLALRLLADGPAAGLHLAVTADRSGLVGRLAAAIDEKLVLRLADPGDYALVGVPSGKAPVAPPPGRAVVARSRTTAQIALLAGSATGADEVAAIEALAARLAQRDAPVPPSRRPRRVAAMPSVVRLDDLDPPTRPGHVTVGVGGIGPDPVEVDLAECGTFTVAGPRASGRSTALASIAAQLQRQGMTVVGVAPRRSRLRDHLDGLVITDPTDGPRLEAAVEQACGRVALVVDDAELLVDTPVGAAVERVANATRDSGAVVVVAGTLDELTVAFRGPGAAARRSRTGVILAPTAAHDGELLGVRLPRAVTGHALPTGRGVLVVSGAATALHVAMPGRRPSQGRGVDEVDRLFDRLEVELVADGTGRG